MICTIPDGYEVPPTCEKEEEEYICEISDALGYQATSPTGYQRINDDIDDKLAELSKLRNRCGDDKIKSENSDPISPPERF